MREAAGLETRINQSGDCVVETRSGPLIGAEARRDIRSHEGIGAVKDVPSAGNLATGFAAEYDAAKASLACKSNYTAGAPPALAAQ